MLATNLSEAEGTEAKLRMAFRLYDKDSSGDQDDQDDHNEQDDDHFQIYDEPWSLYFGPTKSMTLLLFRLFQFLISF